jgi:N-methylhydantoinase A/oxoprolinase/acetone carboxylase beta subunit
MGYGPLVVRQVEELVARRLLLLSSFTPTDALHVLGRFREWDAEASRLAAQLLARRAGMSPEAFCEQVVTEVSNQVTRELVTKVLSDEVSLPNWHQEPSAVALLARAMGVVSDSDLACELKLRHPVVAVGAPVEAYLPRTVTQLGTELVIPHHAQVANAIGAVAGGVVQRLRVLIQPIEADQAYRAYLPDGVRDFSGVEEAVTYAREAASEHIRRLAQRAGAHHIELQIERIDRVAPVQVDWGKDIYVETELVFTAAGRPSPAHEGLPES